jgi:hypothetical protein
VKHLMAPRKPKGFSPVFNSILSRTHEMIKTRKTNYYKKVKYDFHMNKDGPVRKFSYGAFQEKKDKHIFELLSNKIVGAAIEVYKKLGPGFIEIYMRTVVSD